MGTAANPEEAHGLCARCNTIHSNLCATKEYAKFAWHTNYVPSSIDWIITPWILRPYFRGDCWPDRNSNFPFSAWSKIDIHVPRETKRETNEMNLCQLKWVKKFRIFLWHSFPFVSHPIASHSAVAIRTVPPTFFGSIWNSRAEASFYLTLILVIHLFVGFPTAVLPSGLRSSRATQHTLEQLGWNATHSTRSEKKEQTKIEIAPRI